jgi:ribosomal protein S18 acetylase RimI-like enzyme
MTDIELRPATIGDDAELAKLDAESWPVEFQVMPPRAAHESFFEGRRNVEDVIVAVGETGVDGYVHLARHIPVPQNAHVLHLNAIAIAQRAQGQGLSHRLVDAAIAEARRRGVRKLGLRALSNNTRAVHLYESHGFEIEGRMRQEMLLPDGSYADDLWFALFLE